MRKESTTSIMRRGFVSMVALTAALFTSCSSDSDLVNNSSNGEVDLTAVASPKIYNDFGTRSSLSYDPNQYDGMSFKWDKDDKLTVFAEGNDQSKQIYGIVEQNEYSQKAHFTSKDFKLTDGKRYYALSKSEDEHPGGPATKIPDQRNIVIDYSGQKQIGNASPKHLGNYDFMATSAMCSDPDQMHFDFKHLGATLRLRIRPFEDDDMKYLNARFTKLELYSSDNSFREPVRQFNLNEGVQTDGSYVPKLKEPVLTNSSKRFTIDLTDGTETGGVPNGIKPGSAFVDNTTDGKYNLIVYMEVPPVDLQNKKMGLILYGKDSEGNDITYYATRNGFKIDAGEAYYVPFVANKTTDYTVFLKVNHIWQNGNPVDFTRATGDPGNDKDFDLPKYVYLFFCADGEVKQVNSYTDLAENRWSTIDKISTFDTQTKLMTTNDITDINTLRVYAIASKTAISHGISVGNDESTVKAIKYNYDNQENMRGLYSTPWENDLTFIGNLHDPMQDIFVYHVAAKVDLKWNSSTRMDPANDKVKVNEFQSANLSMFMPIKNGTDQATNGVANFTSTLKATVSTDITKGTYINGRQVYYLPQFANETYNVTIGTKTSDLRFTGTPTTGGFTSWLRAQIKQ